MSSGTINATQRYPSLLKTSSIAKSKNNSDAQRRKLFRKYEAQRKVYKSLAYDTQVPLHERRLAAYRLQRLPRNSSPVRQKKRCVLTARSKGNLSDFRISRLCLRELAGEGCLPGFVKASW
jgi:ribosomal protein S14